MLWNSKPHVQLLEIKEKFAKPLNQRSVATGVWKLAGLNPLEDRKEHGDSDFFFLQLFLF